MVDLWEDDIADTLSRGALNMAQITLARILGLEARIPEFRWRPNRRRLSNWSAGARLTLTDVLRTVRLLRGGQSVAATDAKPANKPERFSY